MPIYEYRCRECGKSISLLLLGRGEAESVSCPHCGSRQLDRLLSRFATPKSDEARTKAMSDSSLLEDIDEPDPESSKRTMNLMAAQFGEDAQDEREETLNTPYDEDSEDSPALGDDPP